MGNCWNDEKKDLQNPNLSRNNSTRTTTIKLKTSNGIIELDEAQEMRLIRRMT